MKASVSESRSRRVCPDSHREMLLTKASWALERWQAWIACAGALLVVFVFYNVTHSGIGRSLRAVPGA